MVEPIKIAVIGAGNMGKNHIRTYSKLKDAKLTAVADVNPATQKLADEYGISYYKDYSTLIEQERPQAVSIVVPTPYHFSIGSDLLARGIHCLIEKPIASTVHEADRLVALAEKNKVILTVGHIERFNPLIVKLKELVGNKKVGKITAINCKRVGGFPIREPKTDVIIDLAVHDIDIMSYLLGQHPKLIYSHGSRTLHSNEIDAAEIFIDYGSASGFVQANWITPVKIRTISVTGSKGYIEGNYLTQELTYYEHNMKRVNNGFENFIHALGEPKKHDIVVKIQEPLLIELQNFLDAINDKPQAKIVSPIDAREALQAALKAVEKYKLGFEKMEKKV